MFGVIKQPMPKTRKAVILTAGVFLLIFPFAFILRIVPVSTVYFLIYPVAISLFIYLIREEVNN
jgi:hypothetical protein